jgi:PAS domain S-box-containing protein
MGSRLFEIILHPDDLQKVLQHHERMKSAKDGEIIEAEYRMKHANGTYRVLRSRDIPFRRDSLGGVTQILGHAEDITDRKHMEDALRDSERRFALFMEKLPAAMYLKDLDGHVVFSNRFLNELFGWTDPVGKSTFDLLPVDVAQRMADDDRKAFDQGVMSTVEAVTDIHGLKRYFKTTKFSVPDSGGASLMGGISLDITEQKQTEEELRQSEEKYRTLLFSTGIGVGYWSPDGILLYINEISLKRLNGIKEDFIGKHIRDLIKHDDAEKYLERIHNAAISPQPSEYEDYVTLPTGKSWYLTIYARIVDSSGTVIGIQVLSIDITERKKAELALDVARKKLKMLNTITSHDIQNSAFSLSAYLSLAKKEFNDKKVHEYLDKETDLVQNIIQCLNVTKEFQELGTKPPIWQNVELVFCLAISHLDFGTISQHISLDGLEVYADPLLEKAFLHMMQNTLAQGVRVTEVSISCNEIEGGIRIIIEDNGVGVPGEEKEHIFERGYGKCGIPGLFLVSEILAITGITIQETGEPGKGARFEITVPKDVYRLAGNS